MELSQSILLSLFGFVGLAILAIEVFYKQRQQKDETEWRQKHLGEESKWRQEQENRETEWKQEQYIKETKWREDKIEAEKRMFNEWAGNTDKLATLIKNKLIDSSSLFSNHTKIDSYSEANAIFYDRKRHYADEKKFILNQFVPLLVDRCEHLKKEKKKNICLIVDCGTTMHAFLERFSEEVTMRAIIKQTNININEIENEKLSISVATNNILGAAIAMEKGRLCSIDRFSEMSFKCHLFQGELLPTYSAVTGVETNIAVIKYIKEKEENTYFIGITVGNWIRIRGSEPHVAIPMARGREHRSFKQTLINYSNEIFVISPLAKIFTGCKNKEINKALKLDGSKPWKARYKEIDTRKRLYINEEGKLKVEVLSPDQEKYLINKIKLVTTDRVNKAFLLNGHAHTLKKTAVERQYWSKEDIDKVKEYDIENIASLIMFEFNNLPKDRDIQKEIEFPHKETRDPIFLDNFFNVKV